MTVRVRFYLTDARSPLEHDFEGTYEEAIDEIRSGMIDSKHFVVAADVGNLRRTHAIAFHAIQYVEIIDDAGRR